jgi:hypothetical protein
VLNLPPIICLSTTGDFEYQLEALEGQPPTQLGSVMQSNIFRPYGRHHRKPKIAKIPYVMILRNLSQCWREGRENSKEIETEIAENWNAPLEGAH